MTAGEFRSWQAVHDEVLRRIHAREWKPGEMIPNEADLSHEFGCARATVNRALRSLADTGLLDRRRRAGTRVALHPVRKATLDIPIIRHEIGKKGLAYSYSLLSRKTITPPDDIRARMRTGPDKRLIHIMALHLADSWPYVVENRWINPETVPGILKADLKNQSANEWLVLNIPFESGDIAFFAAAAGAKEAEILDCQPGDALFSIDRSTARNGHMITTVRLTFAPGYRLHTEI